MKYASGERPEIGDLVRKGGLRMFVIYVSKRSVKAVDHEGRCSTIAPEELVLIRRHEDSFCEGDRVFVRVGPGMVASEEIKSTYHEHLITKSGKMVSRGRAHNIERMHRELTDIRLCRLEDRIFSKPATPDESYDTVDGRDPDDPILKHYRILVEENSKLKEKNIELEKELSEIRPDMSQEELELYDIARNKAKEYLAQGLEWAVDEIDSMMRGGGKERIVARLRKKADQARGSRTTVDMIREDAILVKKMEDPGYRCIWKNDLHGALKSAINATGEDPPFSIDDVAEDMFNNFLRSIKH